MPAQRPADSADKPRRHRRLQQFPDSTPAEDQRGSEYAAAQTLAQALGGDPHFMEEVASVRAGHKTAEQVARAYVRRAGRRRRVVERLIQAGADHPGQHPRFGVLATTTFAVWRGAPATPGRRNFRAARWREASALLCHLGAGRCLDCATLLATDNPGRYCGLHEADASTRERADRELIGALLDAAADALRVQ